MVDLCSLKSKKIKTSPVWCGGGVVVCCGGGVVFITDYNTTLRLHWVTLGCGNIVRKSKGVSGLFYALI